MGLTGHGTIVDIVVIVVVAIIILAILAWFVRPMFWGGGIDADMLAGVGEVKLQLESMKV